ncbi:MAG: hypothetical protein HFI34_11160 [Lachnospiraceae bacterium]|nr:hypothetical protein [Lachnospiraceae bacterium]
MAYTFKNYTVRKSKIENSDYRGFVLKENGRLVTTRDGQRHILFLQYIDSGETDLEWGRLKVDASMEGEMVLSIQAFAVNRLDYRKENCIVNLEELILSRERSTEEKEIYFSGTDFWGSKKFFGCEDVLLYGIKGRYLWLCIELIGTGTASLNSINVDSPGDIMLDVFPEIYREKDSFLHRYLSVFSSVFMDLEYKIEGIHNEMDLETASADMLKMFGEWMGLNLSGSFLSEEKLRSLLIRLHSFNRMKGTKQTVLGLTEILLGEPALLVERNLLEHGDRRMYDDLYGSSPYDITLLINGRADEQKQSCLLFYLKQFIPVRSRVKIVFLNHCCNLDSYCYLDMNAAVYSGVPGAADEGQGLDENFIVYKGGLYES